MKVFSFVASSQVKSFSGDLLAFVKYLQSNNGFPSNQYLLSLGAGTEPFTGMLKALGYQGVLTVRRIKCRPYRVSLQHRCELR